MSRGERLERKGKFRDAAEWFEQQQLYGDAERCWENNNHCVKFHFSSPKYRRTFLEEACRLLSVDLWKKLREDDSDPAKPQA